MVYYWVYMSLSLASVHCSLCGQGNSVITNAQNFEKVVDNPSCDSYAKSHCIFAVALE